MTIIPNNKMSLSQQQYDDIDKFISSDPKDIKCPTISIRDLTYGKRLFHEIKEKPGPSYHIFGSGGSGIDTYSLYKSKTDNMYVLSINVYIGTDTKLNVSYNYFKFLEDDSWFQV